MNKKAVLQRAKMDPTYRKRVIAQLLSSPRGVTAHSRGVLAQENLDTDFLLWKAGWGVNPRYRDAEDDSDWMVEKSKTAPNYYVLRMSHYPSPDMSTIYFREWDDVLGLLMKVRKNLDTTIAKVKQQAQRG